MLLPSAAPREAVLVVTYLFPPSGGVGRPRFVSYARYLPRHGCDVSILTVRKPATPTYDAELAKQVPPETRVFRAFNPEVPYALRDRIWKGILSAPRSENKAARSSNWKRIPKELIQRVFNPDVQVVWTPFAIRAMRRIVASRGITTVLVNLPPYSCLRIAAAVKRYFPTVKLILDFRDEWIDNYLRMFDSAANRKKARSGLPPGARGRRTGRLRGGCDPIAVAADSPALSGPARWQVPVCSERLRPGSVSRLRPPASSSRQGNRHIFRHRIRQRRLPARGGLPGCPRKTARERPEQLSKHASSDVLPKRRKASSKDGPAPSAGWVL